MNTVSRLRELFIKRMTEDSETQDRRRKDYCHRCGLYEMHDGAISHQNITLTEAQARRTRIDFEREVLEIRSMLERLDDDREGEA